MKIIDFTRDSVSLIKDSFKKVGYMSFPTETVYGLGSSIYNEDGLERIFELKKRPNSHPLIVHVSDKEAAFLLWDLLPPQKIIIQTLINSFWPGPLTIIAKAQKHLSLKITGQSREVGIRIPNNREALEVLKLFGPLAAPSANQFGHISPVTAEDVQEEFPLEEGFIIQGGKCLYSIESTVLRILESGDVQMIRPGMISIPEISLKGIHWSETQKSTQRLPGQSIQHYSPRKPLKMVKNHEIDSHYKKSLQNQKFGIMDFNQTLKEFKNSALEYYSLSENDNYQEALENIYSALRYLEKIENIDFILCPEGFKTKNSLSDVLHDRILRASAGKYYDPNNRDS